MKISSKKRKLRGLRMSPRLRLITFLEEFGACLLSAMFDGALWSAFVAGVVGFILHGCGVADWLVGVITVGILAVILLAVIVWASHEGRTVCREFDHAIERLTTAYPEFIGVHSFLERLNDKSSVSKETIEEGRWLEKHSSQMIISARTSHKIKRDDIRAMSHDLHVWSKRTSKELGIFV